MTMMTSIKKVFTERPDLLMLYVFLWSLPFTWRKVLFIHVPAPYFGYNEYLSGTLSVSEILLAGTVLLYIKYNKTYQKSNSTNSHDTGIFRYGSHLILWSFLSIFWSYDHSLALTSAFRLFMAGVLFWYLWDNFINSWSQCSTWNILRNIGYIFLYSSIIQVVIGTLQVVLGHSIGLGFLGESILSLDMAGVAKLYVNSTLLLRPYGTFLHPNLLAAFLLFSLIYLLLLTRLKMFHVEHWSTRLIFGILVYGIILTFSKNVIIALLSLSLFLMVKDLNDSGNGQFVPRGTLNSLKEMFHVEHFLFISSILASFYILIYQNSHYLKQSIEERIDLIPISERIISQSPITGIGIGQFVYTVAESKSLLSWQLQPIHNVYILIFSELGIIGVFFFFMFIKKVLNVPRGTLKSILIGGVGSFLILGLFDHYIWDLWVGQVLFVMMLGHSALKSQLDNAQL